VGMATGYGLDGRSLIPGRAKIFLFSTASRPALRPTQLPIKCELGALCPGIKQPGSEAERSPPTDADVKSSKAIPPLPQTSSGRGAELIKQRDKFTFTFPGKEFRTSRNERRRQ
jgi:hypothetical protein